MMFLKKIEAYGFKSYAEKTIINLDESFIGIVGANGSGKTNIVDAIRWVLGETSAKQLRGETNNDIIFYGSDGFLPANEASVTLYFDNSNKVLNINEHEVTVKRVLKRNSDSSDYFLNDKIVKRKDIIDLFLDTGLSKGSLGIISQGTVQWFVDAKPEERRKIFEEAAGVGKYIKNKNEYLVELEKVHQDLNTLSISVREYENSVKKLEAQSIEVNKYLELKSNLEKYQLYIAKQNYLHYSKKLIELNNEIENINKVINLKNTDLVSLNLSFTNVKEQKSKEEDKVSLLNKKRFDVQEKINNLITRKLNYENNLKNQLSSTDKKIKVAALSETLANLELEYKTWIKNVNTNKDEITKIINIKNELTNNYRNISGIINKQYQDLSELKAQQNFIQQRINDEFKNEVGVNAILQNRDAIPGLIDPLKKLITKVDAKYAKAIELALGKNINTLVVSLVNDAIAGIEFLKKNKLGVASFIALNGIKLNDNLNDKLIIAKNFDGFIDTADKLLTIDEQYYPVVKLLVGNVLIVNNIQTAETVAKAIKRTLKIITLDGDVINRGGLYVGGHNNKTFSSFTLKEENEKYLKGIEKLSKLISDNEILKLQLENQLTNINEQYSTASINESTSNQKINELKNNIEKIKTELTSLNIDTESILKQQTNEIIENLSKLEIEKNNLSNQISSQNHLNIEINNKFNEISELLNKFNSEILSLKDKLFVINNNKNVAEKIIEDANKIANSYKLTIDNINVDLKDLNLTNHEINEKIIKLKAEISTFGNINLKAIDDLKQTKEKLDELQKNMNDIQKAEYDLTGSISKIDKEVIKIFKNKIFQINQTLPSVFSKLFKNGGCELQFTNPEDLLNTGIDVIVKLSGKQIRKLNVLSGGEKSIISLSILLTILKTSKFPLVILDEAESALDPKNAESLAKLITENAKLSQFIVVTHRKETMVECDSLLGASMQKPGVTCMNKIKVKLHNDKQ